MIKQKQQSVGELRREVNLLRSFVIGFAGRDNEGKYRPAFVRRVLVSASEAPRHQFTTADNFLAHLQD